MARKKRATDRSEATASETATDAPAPEVEETTATTVAEEAGPIAPADLPLPASEVNAIFEMADIPPADRAHAAAPRLLEGYAFYLKGDYPAARDILIPIAEGRIEAPASFRKASETLFSVTGLETGSLIFGAVLVAFFAIVLLLLY